MTPIDRLQKWADHWPNYMWTQTQTDALQILITEHKQALLLLRRWQQPDGKWSANIDTDAFFANQESDKK